MLLEKARSVKRLGAIAPGNPLVSGFVCLGCVFLNLGNKNDKNPDFLQIQVRLLMNWELGAIAIVWEKPRFSMNAPMGDCLEVMLAIMVSLFVDIGSYVSRA